MHIVPHSVLIIMQGGQCINPAGRCQLHGASSHWWEDRGLGSV